MLAGGCEVQAEQPSDPSRLPRQVETLVRLRPGLVRPPPPARHSGCEGMEGILAFDSCHVCVV
jgi:hypothetical protein